jgi:LemA protein
MTILWIFLAVLIILLLYVIFLYNQIIRKSNQTDFAFGSIDAMLKKRYDLIPNLVETVRQYMSHEANVLTEITRLRTGLSSSMSNEEKMDIHQDISRKLNGVLFAMENYPDLKASMNFLKLQGAWNEAEEQISAARRFYNSTIADYNNSIQTFPASLITSIFGFKPKKVFEIEDAERNNIHAASLFENK